MAFLGIFVGLLTLVALDPSSARHVVGTDAITQDLSGDICTGTLDQASCFQMIKEIPGAAKATTLEALGVSAIPFARSTGANDVSFIKSLAGSAKDPMLKENYNSCAENYDNAVGDLEEAESMFKSKDYGGVSTRASACMTEVDTCNDNFSDTTDPSDLPKKSKEFNALCVIVLRISNKLGGISYA